uniref:Protein TIC 214 n=1 Tax=Eosphagnum rigescens TaxID=1846180 RepID=A0A172N806_9BRYO|nr:hypothetical protein RF1 [Eosphagnum rigescens]
MITNTPLLLSVLWAPILSWIDISSSLILFGLYYGFLTTLPIGPSQILSIRAFLLEGKLSGTAAVSGLIMGQLIIFLSIYYSPLYIILVKPHTVTLLVLPYILFHWYRTKDLLDYQSLRPITSISDARVHKIFIDSFIFQLLNPVLLPSPVLARLVNLFLFRHSNQFLFVMSCFFGWLSGHLFFFHSVKLLLVRVERDSPVFYLLLKRLIHRTFSIIIFACCLLYLGRAPVPLLTKKINDDFRMNQLKVGGLSRSNRVWPTFFFDYRRWNRPLRYIENSRFSTKGLVKKQVSQYFFDICLSDGKQKISFTALPSLSIFGNDLKRYLNIPSNSFFSGDSYNEWIDTKKKRKDILYQELGDRIEALDDAFLIKDTIEKRTGFSTNEGNLTKVYDPFLNRSFRGEIAISKSPWLLTEDIYQLKKNRKLLHLSKGNNKLKFWISDQWRGFGRRNLPPPWEPLSKDARRILVLLIRGSKNGNHLQQMSLSEEQAPATLNNQKNYSDLSPKTGDTNFLNRKTTRASHLNWELLSNLSARQRTFYFNHLEREKWQTLERSWKNIFSGNLTQVRSIPSLLVKTLYLHKKSQLQEIHKEVPRWTSKLRNDKFDVIAIGVTDIRQRKVKNLGYLIKGKDKRRKIVRRFSQQSDFRRRLVKGSMRARRRKIPVWKILQLKTHSPFFFRINERHFSFQSSFGVLNLINVRNTSKDSIGIGERIISFPNSNRNGPLAKRTRADRLAIANRWDFPLAQWGRSWLLIIQSYLRKYLVLPVLIISKNIVRLLLFQIPEWNEDWNEWNKEIHIKCTYDGTEVSEKELPEQWLRDGLQIKIIYPFFLKPWRDSQFETSGGRKKYIDDSHFFNNGEKILNTSSNDISSNNGIEIRRKKKINYSFLTAWGFQTKLPFGNMKKQPSFWKPISKELKRRWKRNVLSKTTQIFKIYSNFFLIINGHTSSTESDIRINKSRRNYVLRPGSNNRYEAEIGVNDAIIDKLSIGSASNSNDEIPPEFGNKMEYGIPTNVQKLENRKYLINYQIGEITKNLYFDGIESRNKFGDGNEKYGRSEEEKLEQKNKLIEIQQLILKLYRKNIKSIKKWSHFMGILSNRIKIKIKKNYFHFLRSGIQFVINFRRNFIFLNRGIFNNSKFNIFRLTFNQQDRIINKHSNTFDEKAQNSEMKLDRRDVVPVSQAYVFHKMRQMDVINKFDFEYLLINWTLNSITKKGIKHFLEKQGILFIKEPRNLEEINWKEWLRTFDKYDTSPKIWYGIAPYRWRSGVTHHWKENKKISFSNFDEQEKSLVSYRQQTISYRVATNPSLKQTDKLDKRYKYNILCFSYLDPDKKSEVEKTPKLRRKGEGTISSSYIHKIREYQTINYEKKNENDNYSAVNSDKERNLFFKSDSTSWLNSELMKKRYVYGTKEIDVPSISLMKDRNRTNIRNEKSLRERERHQTIRQWRWGSKNVEKKFKELGDVASLMTLMQNQEDVVSLSAKMREDLDLFRLLFCRDTGTNQLTINSEHRLPQVLDDQNLMYKMVGIPSKFINRFERKSDLDIFDGSIAHIEFIHNDEGTNINTLSLEDIILPRHRREFKILNCLYLEKTSGRKVDSARYLSGKNQRDCRKLMKSNWIPNENRKPIIKRFLWPSFRLEDLACINRFWFNTNNGSRFTMLRIRLYAPGFY